MKKITPELAMKIEHSLKNYSWEEEEIKRLEEKVERLERELNELKNRFK